MVTAHSHKAEADPTAFENYQPRSFEFENHVCSACTSLAIKIRNQVLGYFQLYFHVIITFATVVFKIYLERHLCNDGLMRGGPNGFQEQQTTGIMRTGVVVKIDIRSKRNRNQLEHLIYDDINLVMYLRPMKMKVASSHECWTCVYLP